MKHRRRTVCLLLALALCILLPAGCGADGSTPEAEAAEASGETESASSAVTGVWENGFAPVLSETRLRLTVDGEEIVFRLYSNSAARALQERLPMELTFFEASEGEKQTDVPEEPFSAEEEDPGYDPVPGELVLRRTWGNLAVLTEELPFMDDAVPIGYAESGLEVLLEQTEDFSGVLELLPQE